LAEVSESELRIDPPPGRRLELDLWLVIFAALGYSLIWTTISILSIFSFRASVYDLGVFAQAGWRIYSGHLSAQQFIVTYFNVGGTIFFSPIVLGGYEFIVAFQSFALGFSSVLVYLIARRHHFSPRAALTFGVVYLLYFPLAGINFTEAHYEAFLIPLFFAGYLFFLQGRFLASFLTLTVAASLKFPLATFVVLFGAITALPAIANLIAQRMGRSGIISEQFGAVLPRIRYLANRVAGWKDRHVGPSIPKWYSFGLPIIAGVILLGGFLTNPLYSPGNGVSGVIHASSVGVSSDLALKWWSVALLLAPLAFTPLLSPRWMILCAPFFSLLFFVNYVGYTYPYVVTDWYTCLVLPFLILGMVDGVDRFRRGTTWVDALVVWVRKLRTIRWPPHSARSGRSSPMTWVGPARNGKHRHGRPIARSSEVMTTFVLLLVLTSAAFFTPYGPLNSSTAADFDLPSLAGYNATLYAHFLELSALIPRTDPAVILQDNMPELLPRPLPAGSLSPLVAGPFDQVAYNLTRPAQNGSWVPINPDYVIGNPTPSVDNFFSAPGLYPFNISMQQILSELYGSYTYGILGEANGMLLLDHHYGGPLQYYVPFEQQFAPYTFRTIGGQLNSSTCLAACLFNGPLTNGTPSWYGPYTYLAPGTYDVTFDVGLTGWTPSDHVSLQVTSDLGANLLGSTVLFGPTAGSETVREQVVLKIQVSNGAGQTEFTGVSSSYNGSLALYGVNVREIVPPPTIFRVGNSSDDLAIYRLLNLTAPHSPVLAEVALRPFFENNTLVTASTENASNPPPYELYDPAIPSNCAPLEVSVCSIANGSLASGQYGVLGQLDGITLLERGSRALATYAPLTLTEIPANFSIAGGPGQIDSSFANGILVVRNQTNGGWSWFGPYASLPPGTYDATFELSVTNTSPQNEMRLDISTWFGKDELGVTEINGSMFARENMSENITIPFDNPDFSSSVEFRGWHTRWSGTVYLLAVELTEVGPWTD
jgi:uncharacterized membrane protein